MSHGQITVPPLFPIFYSCKGFLCLECNNGETLIKVSPPLTAFLVVLSFLLLCSPFRPLAILCTSVQPNVSTVCMLVDSRSLVRFLDSLPCSRAQVFRAPSFLTSVSLRAVFVHPIFIATCLGFGLHLG